MFWAIIHGSKQTRGFAWNIWYKCCVPNEQICPQACDRVVQRGRASSSLSDPIGFSKREIRFEGTGETRSILSYVNT